MIWKKVEEYLRLFETYGGNRFSPFLMGSLGKLVCVSGRMTLRMKLIAKKELILLFQMTPSRILCDWYFGAMIFLIFFAFFAFLHFSQKRGIKLVEVYSGVYILKSLLIPSPLPLIFFHEIKHWFYADVMLVWNALISWLSLSTLA